MDFKCIHNCYKIYQQMLLCAPIEQHIIKNDILWHILNITLLYYFIPCIFQLRNHCHRFWQCVYQPIYIILNFAYHQGWNMLSFIGNILPKPPLNNHFKYQLWLHSYPECQCPVRNSSVRYREEKYASDSIQISVAHSQHPLIIITWHIFLVFFFI